MEQVESRTSLVTRVCVGVRLSQTYARLPASLVTWMHEQVVCKGRHVCISVCVCARVCQPVLASGSAEPPAGQDRLHPTFITTWSCPYAQRTWIALNAKGIDFTPVFVDLMDKPSWFFKHNP